jgi:hypothetical protein
MLDSLRGQKKGRARNGHAFEQWLGISHPARRTTRDKIRLFGLSRRRGMKIVQHRTLS